MDSLRVLALSVIVFGLFGQPALANKRVALVIGNSAYEHVSPLSNPTNDSASMAETFRSAGFDVVDVRHDLKATEMRRVLREFSNNVSDSDFAVVYFAGHGLEIDGTNYLIPVDATLERDIDAFDEAIPLDRILTVIEPAKQLRLIILDACRDNPFSKTMKRTIGSRAISRGLAKVEPTSPNTLIAYAAKAGSTASDGDSKNSPFTAALVKHITKPGLDLRKAFGFVRDDVLKSTKNRQEPYVYGSLGGEDLPLVPANSIASTPGSDPQADVRRDYELALQLGTKAAWISFLQTYQTGFYADLARGQLDKAADTTAAKNEQKLVQQKLVSLSPAEKPVLSSAELIHLVQVELRRVGCLNGSTGDEWTPAVRRSLELFNKYSGSELNTKVASVDALDAIKTKQARICPLTCSHGFKPDNESCVKITCDTGLSLNDRNECEKKHEKPSAMREKPAGSERPKQKQVQSGSPKPQASGQIICNQQGCRPVRQGCRAGPSSKTWVSATGQVEICN
jgi:Caspase domain